MFLGTPQYGSPAIAGYLKNHLWGFELLALLGRYLDRSTFRSLQGVLNLLPAPVDVYPDATGSAHPCGNFELYDVEAWHLDLNACDRAALATVLDDTARLYRELHAWHGGLDPELRERMVIIAGVGRRTLFRIAYRTGFGTLWRHMDRTTRREPGNAHREGDGRVPLASALLTGVETRYVEGEHGRLPSIPAVYQDTFRFLRGEPMTLAHSPEEALDHAHLADTGKSITPVLASRGATVVGDDPGYLNMTDVDEATLDRLDAAAAAGRLPAFARVGIF